MRHIVVESIFIAALVASPASAETERAPELARYCVTEIGDLPDRGWHSYVWDINERGQVLGVTGVPGGSHVFIWDRNHGTVDSPRRRMRAVLPQCRSTTAGRS